MKEFIALMVQELSLIEKAKIFCFFNRKLPDRIFHFQTDLNLGEEEICKFYAKVRSVFCLPPICISDRLSRRKNLTERYTV